MDVVLLLRRRSGWRSDLSALAATLLIVITLGTLAAPFAWAATVDTEAWYVLVNRHSGKTLDLYNLATNDGATIAQCTRNDGAWQQWMFVDSGGECHRLKSRHSSKVLDVLNRSTADSASIAQCVDTNGANQQTPPLNPCRSQFLYQGQNPNVGGDYFSLPRWMGRLIQTNFMC